MAAVSSLAARRLRRPSACSPRRPASPSQLRGNLQAFLTGGVTALAFGYFRLHQDVYRASDAVAVRLQALGEESTTTHKALQARVDTLEDELKKLKSALPAAS